MTRARAVAACAALVAFGACSREKRREVAPESVVAPPLPGSASGLGAGTATGGDPGAAGSAWAPGPGAGPGTASGLAAAGVAIPGCDLPATPWRFPSQPRVVALGDVHGDQQAAREVLRLAGVIDDQDRWSGGTTWVVQTGDILDRGDDEQALLDWFERLETEAAEAGGRFLWLLGNHELMNTAGDLRYVTPAGMRDFDDVPGLPLDRFASADEDERARRAAFAPGGPYAKIQAGQNYVAIVGDTVFVHGGIRPGWAELLDADTLASRCWMAGQGRPPRALEDDTGPLWDRSFAREEVDCARLATSLAELGVARMVVGHTPQEQGITSACDGKVWRIDTGMARAYGGPRQALELAGGAAKILK